MALLSFVEAWYLRHHWGDHQAVLDSGLSSLVIYQMYILSLLKFQDKSEVRDIELYQSYKVDFGFRYVISIGVFHIFNSDVILGIT